MSLAQRERDAKAYWDSLTEAQEVWALRKMGYFQIGERRATPYRRNRCGSWPAERQDWLEGGRTKDRVVGQLCWRAESCPVKLRSLV